MSLKIEAKDLQSLKDAIEIIDTPARRDVYRKRDFPHAQLCQDLNKRYRWDLLYASGLKIGDGLGVKGDLDLYAYLDDTHIDSALREIVAPL